MTECAKFAYIVCWLFVDCISLRIEMGRMFLIILRLGTVVFFFYISFKHGYAMVILILQLVCLFSWCLTGFRCMLRSLMVEINVRRLRGDRFFETNQDKTIEVYKKSYENHGSM